MLSERAGREAGRLEIVFLPCRASMWDCMDSVWRAAAADPRCDVYVVPLPYYERHPDGSLGALHYEGAMLPPDVPVTDYRAYDIAGRRPDVAYVHDPFDDENMSTSGEPRFYLRNLRRHVGTLVYLPYFLIGAKLLPEMHAGHRSFAFVDKVIVHTQAAKAQMDELWGAGKAVALGSPKSDAIFRASARKYDRIPPEWRARVQGKTVLLCSLAIGTLGYGEFLFAKFAYICEQARRHPNLVLLWRPHPLYRMHIAAQVPHLAAAYEELVSWFVQSGLGILDETPNAEPSVALADAYLGDYSSITTLFGLLGKPVYLLDNQLPIEPTEDNLLTFVPNGFYRDGQSLYFLSPKWNLLCRMSLEDGALTVVAHMPRTTGGDGQYAGLVCLGRKLYSLAVNTSQLCEYDMDSGAFRLHGLGAPAMRYAFSGIFLYGTSIFATPGLFPELVRFDTDTGEARGYRECVAPLAALRGDEGEMLIRSSALLGDTLLLFAHGHNKFVEINLNNFACATRAFGGDDEARFYGAIPCGNDGDLLSLPWINHGELARWNRETGALRAMGNFPPGYDCPEPCDTVRAILPFSAAVPMGDSLYLFPNCANMIVKYNASDGGMSEFRYKFPRRPEERAWPRNPLYGGNYAWAMPWSDHEILAGSGYDFSWHLIDVDTGDYKAFPCRLPAETLNRPNESLREMFVAPPSGGYYVMETMRHTADWYMTELERRNYDSEAIAAHYASGALNADGTCGQKVHGYVTDVALERRAGAGQ